MTSSSCFQIPGSRFSPIDSINLSPIEACSHQRAKHASPCCTSVVIAPTSQTTDHCRSPMQTCAFLVALWLRAPSPPLLKSSCLGTPPFCLIARPSTTFSCSRQPCSSLIPASSLHFSSTRRDQRTTAYFIRGYRPSSVATACRTTSRRTTPNSSPAPMRAHGRVNYFETVNMKRGVLQGDPACLCHTLQPLLTAALDAVSGTAGLELDMSARSCHTSPSPTTSCLL